MVLVDGPYQKSFIGVDAAWFLESGLQIVLDEAVMGLDMVGCCHWSWFQEVMQLLCVQLGTKEMWIARDKNYKAGRCQREKLWIMLSQRNSMKKWLLDSTIYPTLFYSSKRYDSLDSGCQSISPFYSGVCKESHNKLSGEYISTNNA